MVIFYWPKEPKGIPQSKPVYGKPPVAVSRQMDDKTTQTDKIKNKKGTRKEALLVKSE